MSRKDNAAIIVDLRIIVTGTKGKHDPIAAIHRGIRDLLARRVAATKSSGPCVVNGVEGMEEGEPVHLDGGATAILNWSGLELVPEEGDAALCKVVH